MVSFIEAPCGDLIQQIRALLIRKNFPILFTVGVYNQIWNGMYTTEEA